MSTNQAETAEEVEKLFKVIGETRTGDMNVEDWVYPEWQTLINSIRSLQARNNELEAENKLLRGALEQAARESCYCEWTDCSHDKAKEALKFSPSQK